MKDKEIRMKRNKFKLALGAIIFIASFIFLISQIVVEKTIPQDIQISEIREFVINVSDRTIDVHLENGRSYTLNRAGFLNFWNNMTATQRNVVRGFIKQCTTLAADVTADKVTGDFSGD